MRCSYLLLGIMAVLLVSISCGKQKPVAERPTAAVETPAARPSATAVAASPTAPARESTPSPPRVDGTVDPLNAGSTDRVVVKSNPDPLVAIALLKDVRMGVHPEEGGWDRIVFEFSGGLPAGAIEYVSDVAHCASGAPETLPGKATLLAHFTGVDAHDDRGQPTIPATRLQGPGTTILEARQVCDFEGVVAWAIGLKGVQRFKVTKLSSPFRVVVDIKQ